MFARLHLIGGMNLLMEPDEQSMCGKLTKDRRQCKQNEAIGPLKDLDLTNRGVFYNPFLSFLSFFVTFLFRAARETRLESLNVHPPPPISMP
jgi:hypothetical protein